MGGGGFSSEIYVEDCYMYDSLTSDKGYWDKTQFTGASASFTSNGLVITGSGMSNKFMKLDSTYPSSYSLEYEIVALNRASGYIVEASVEGVSIQCNLTNIYLLNLANWGSRTEYSGTLSAGDVMKFVYQNNTVSVYQNGTLIGSKSKSSSYSRFIINQYDTRGFTIKDLKIRTL